MARRTDICVDDFRMDRPHANPSPLGAINPLRFGNSSGKSLVRDLRNKQEPEVMSPLHCSILKQRIFAMR
jgi:hypothetical protein